MDIKHNESDILELIYYVKNYEGSSISVAFNTEKQYKLVKKVFRYSNNNYIKPKAVDKLIITASDKITTEELLRYLIGLRDYIFKPSKVKIPQEVLKSYYKNEIKLEKDKTRVARLKNQMKESCRGKKTIKRGYNGFNEFICDIELYYKTKFKFGSLVKHSPNSVIKVMSKWKSFGKFFSHSSSHHKHILKNLMEEDYTDSYFDKLYSESDEE